LVGDLVNRGPQSLKVLRHVMSLGDAAQCVLGNHDLHLLAVAAGIRPLNGNDTFSDVLRAKDSEELLKWLRHRPLVIHDPSMNRLLVHAGVPPGWTVNRTLRQAGKIESLLQSDDWTAALKAMYGNLPTTWSKSLSSAAQRRYTINALTRMRFCDKRGNLDMEYSGPPGTQPKQLVPWFQVANRKAKATHIFFGHWSALGFFEGRNFTALDSGCIWGRRLTAIKLKKSSHPRTRVNCEA
jgi:bis(5'-nucleosyl)-tetraphosphatase (symmetrical)